jgi:hypothetical protein
VTVQPFDDTHRSIDLDERWLNRWPDPAMPHGLSDGIKSVIRRELGVQYGRSPARLVARWAGAAAAAALLLATTLTIFSVARNDRAVRARWQPIERFVVTLASVEYEDAELAVLAYDFDGYLRLQNGSLVDSQFDRLADEIDAVSDDPASPM